MVFDSMMSQKSIWAILLFRFSVPTSREAHLPLHLTNGFYVGLTKQRSKVKVAAERWRAIVDQEIQAFREAWAHSQNEKTSPLVGGFAMVKRDFTGRVIEEPDIPQATLEDAPPYRIQEITNDYLKPERWVNHPANIDINKYAKLP